MTTVIEFYIGEKHRKQAKKELKTYIKRQDQVDDIEQGLYDYAEQYCRCHNNTFGMAQGIYIDSMMNLLFNLEQDNRTMHQIVDKINKNKYNAYNLAFLEPSEMDEDKWSKIILRKNTTEEKINNRATITWKSCKDCKSNKYFFYQLQTRSADEPMTTYYECRECGKTYKFNN